jgi:phage repressor protein C with HTH and peptisase S24 domain
MGAAMLNHKDVWNGIDRLAAGTGFSPSGLARRSGLDPTTFNKSKRINPQGKPRWPPTESISKILEATGLTLSSMSARRPARATGAAIR